MSEGLGDCVEAARPVALSATAARSPAELPGRGEETDAPGDLCPADGELDGAVAGGTKLVTACMSCWVSELARSDTSPRVAPLEGGTLSVESTRGGSAAGVFWVKKPETWEARVAANEGPSAATEERG